MEPNQKDQPPVREHHDVDLGTVLYKTGQVINKIAKFIGDFFNAIFQATMLGLLFLRRNFIWLVLGGIIGLGYGLYQSMASGFKYVSVSTVKMNFESTRVLYTTIDYLNSLRGRGNFPELSKVFNISAKDAMAISAFEAAPIVNDLIVADLYKEKFIRYRRNELVRQDTFWTKIITFEDFKKQLSKYDYPVHEITAIGTDPEIFSKLQQGIVNLVSQNEMLRRNKELLQTAFKEEDQILENSLKQLDTLSSSYNKRILREGNEKGGIPSNLTILEKTMSRTPELDLYSTKLVLKDELTALRVKNITEQDIVQVYSPFNPLGKQQGLYSQSYFKSALNGLILTFAILLGIAVFRFLGKVNPNTFMKK